MIYNFTTPDKPGVNEVGGKGFSLMRMTRAGLPVPPGFNLPVGFFEPWISELRSTPEWEALQEALRGGDDLSPSTDDLKAACENLELTADQREQLDAALTSLPDGALLAVRSSSPEEDLAGASFAGGYETELGVTKETLPDALRSSFVSAFDERVFVYKREQGFATDDPRIAVIVQQQISSERAGVGFSLNPITNDYDEAVVDSNWGLGESVVSGQVSPDHFVVNKQTRSIVEKSVGGKETSVWLQADGGTAEKADPRTDELSLTDAELFEIVDMISRVEELYEQPMDTEWAYAEGELYMLQARPITAYVPLPPEMRTEPGEDRILYLDAALTEGLTTNAPISPMTLDWLFKSVAIWANPFVGPVEVPADGDPHESILFGTGGRYYMNLSQLLTLFGASNIAKLFGPADALLGELLENLDEDRYRAREPVDALRWSAIARQIPRALWHSRRFIGDTVYGWWSPERFYRRYERAIADAEQALKVSANPNMLLNAVRRKHDAIMGPVLSEFSFPALLVYFYYLWRLNRLFADEPEENQRLADTMKTGLSGNEAVNISMQLYRLTRMLDPEEFNDLDSLTNRLENRELPEEFMAAWAEFVEQYGSRGPGELDLSNPRYGDEPRLALEQMSYMAESTFDPEKSQEERVANRKAAYEQLQEKLDNRKSRQLERAYGMIDMMGGTRDTPKYLMVLANGAFRRRALIEADRLVEKGRLDNREEIFYLTLDEVSAANADPAYDLREVLAKRLPFYQKLKQVDSFPHLIDSRGRIGQVETPQDDPDVYTGLGISRGTATGRIKILQTPREKPVEKGDVLVAYTTDPGWTPLFLNAEAVILEVGGMLQHGGVVAREYGKPCVAGIQGVTTKLRDGQKVEVDGTTGVVRLLE
ncbi:PEP/pyruvate-binding domain-containing protein [Rubrobacter aplysinae]|uniref:PEP/pyruvate-binding domain-containing protein n=1 Tax=Rubrobacter aplysinae TaxID=909625 RepID=UPI00064BF98A|nr:PEP/pyruvate-binding domain-containing protein [Rubrobacter aplysinae]